MSSSPAPDAASIRAERADLVGRGDLVGRALAAQLARQADRWLQALGGDLPPGWALVATGGYAGGLLCPGSDLDVMLLHPARAAESAVGERAEHIWYPLWDAGLKLSPAVHTPKDLLALAARDLVTATAILGVRALAGDAALVADVRQRATGQWRKRSSSWLRMLHDASAQRWSRAGEVGSRLEPDLKDGRGGLRDVDVLRWALLSARDDVIAALEAPLAELGTAADALLAVRCELHRVTMRPSNVLLLQDQDEVASALGDADADVLMRRVSAAARAIDWAGERFWRRVERVLDPPRWPGHRSRPLAEPVTGLTVTAGELHLDGAADLADPALIFSAAAAAARNDVPLSREALAALADGSPGTATPPSTPVAWRQSVRQAFLALLGSGEPVVRTVEALEHYGLFSRLLPEWRLVRSLPQRNAFHVDNVDRHLLRTVVHASRLVRTVSRPDLLLVAALLHDIGKGDQGDHTAVGVELVGRMLPRMGFSAEDTATVVALVEHHLLLAETATRRDLSDPKTAANVAAAVGDLQRLGLLRALTEADSLATGPAAWSRWKATLVDQLVRAVTELLSGRAAPTTVDVEERCRVLLARARRSATVEIERDDTRDVVRLRVAAPDQRGLFARVTGTLVLHRLDVMAADVWTTADGIGVQQFDILRGATELELDQIEGLDRLQRDLRDVVTGQLDLDARLHHRIRSGGFHRRLAAAPARTEITLGNDASDSTTVVDIRLPDGPAVLYRLASALTAHGVDITAAKVATLGHEVVDVFYVRQPGPPSRQLSAPEQDELRRAMWEVVGGVTR